MNWSLPEKNVRIHAPDFFRSTKKLPADARLRILALTDLLLELQSRFSTGQSGTDIQQQGLDVVIWLGELYGAKPVAERYRPLQETLKSSSVSRQYLLDYVDALNTRLLRRSMESWEQFRFYARQRAESPALALGQVLGIKSEDSKKHTAPLALAWTIARVLENVADDAKKGWIYIPREELMAAGVEPAEFREPLASKQAHTIISRFAQSGLQNVNLNHSLDNVIYDVDVREWVLLHRKDLIERLEIFAKRPSVCFEKKKKGLFSYFSFIGSKE